MSDAALAIGGLFMALAGYFGWKKSLPAPVSVSSGGVIANYTAAQIETMAMERAQQILHLREGFRQDVYRDSLGYLTVGIGHKVLVNDNLEFGQVISKERVWQFFYADVAKAFDAAKKQAKQLGKYTPEMIAALTSVNFQLGTNWTQTFYTTWPALLRGDWYTAEQNLRQSKWYKQTPVRVEDFITEIRRAFK